MPAKQPIWSVRKRLRRLAADEKLARDGTGVCDHIPRRPAQRRPTAGRRARLDCTLLYTQRAGRVEAFPSRVFMNGNSEKQQARKLPVQERELL